jgi:hypothetical protein
MKLFRKLSHDGGLSLVMILVLAGFLFTACSEKATTGSKGDALKKLGSLQNEDEALKAVQESKPAETGSAPSAAPAKNADKTKSQ